MKDLQSFGLSETDEQTPFLLLDATQMKFDDMQFSILGTILRRRSPILETIGPDRIGVQFRIDNSQFYDERISLQVGAGCKFYGTDTVNILNTIVQSSQAPPVRIVQSGAISLSTCQITNRKNLALDIYQADTVELDNVELLSVSVGICMAINDVMTSLVMQNTTITGGSPSFFSDPFCATVQNVRNIERFRNVQISDRGLGFALAVLDTDFFNGVDLKISANASGLALKNVLQTQLLSSAIASRADAIQMTPKEVEEIPVAFAGIDLFGGTFTGQTLIRFKNSDNEIQQQFQVKTDSVSTQIRNTLFDGTSLRNSFIEAELDSSVISNQQFLAELSPESLSFSSMTLRIPEQTANLGNKLTRGNVTILV
jgi:hypothetical protein